VKPRTPPPTQPNGYEKSTERIEVACTPTEKLTWECVFGKGHIPGTARKLLHKAAARLAKV
jgi:hypothetical protein